MLFAPPAPVRAAAVVFDGARQPLHLVGFLAGGGQGRLAWTSARKLGCTLDQAALRSEQLKGPSPFSSTARDIALLEFFKRYELNEDAEFMRRCIQCKTGQAKDLEGEAQRAGTDDSRRNS